MSDQPVCNSENKAKWYEKSQISETYTECLIVSKYVCMVTDLTYCLEMDTKFLTNQIVFDKKITISNTQRLVKIVLISQKKSWKFGSVVLEFIDGFGDQNSE